MDAWSYFFIIVFGIVAIIPATWAVIGLIQGNTRFWPAVAGTGFAVGLLLVTIIGAATKWGGCPAGGGTSEGSVQCFAKNSDEKPGCTPDMWKVECGQTKACPDKTKPEGNPIPTGKYCPAGQIAVFPFCERIREGGIKQPWATWSDLSFIAAGLWVLWFLHKLPDSTVDNPMQEIAWLSVTYGFIAIFMGPPSQWFHASMKDWAGWFDGMSVVIWLSFNAVYVFYMLLRTMWDKGRGIARPITILCFWGGWVTMMGLWAIKPNARIWTYVFSGVLWGIAEVIYIFVAAYADRVIYRRTWWLFVINVSLLALTMGVWAFFHDGVLSPATCQSRQSFPGHALFHILAAGSTVLTFFSFRSERKV